MTNEKKQHIRAELIRLKFWGADEPGDPLTDEDDARTVHSRIDDRLISSAFMASFNRVANSSARTIVVRRGELSYEISQGANLQEAICKAALALPEFLQEHPELAGEIKTPGQK